MNDIQEVLSADVAAVDSASLGLSDAQLCTLYEAMATTRGVDERCRGLHADGEIGLYVASRGLEAVSVAAAFALQRADWLFPSQRDVGMYLLRGGSIRAWFDQLFGNADDPTKGRRLPGQGSLPDGRFVSVSGSVGAQIVQAAGCAMAIKARHDDACTLASFGEAASSGADFHSAMNIAARFRVPAVLVCRSARSGLAAHVGARASVAERAESYGVPSTRVEGSDVLAVYRAVDEARSTAIQGGGPTLVEAVLDEDALFGEGIVSTGAGVGGERDPVARLREFLEYGGHWDAAREEQLVAGIRERVEEAVAAAREAPKPAPATIFEDVYEQMPWMLQEQCEQLLGRESD